MPLPVSINYLDANSEEKTVVVKPGKKDSGYEPTPEYYPTYKVVRCKDCQTVGVVEFIGGFDLKAGDRLMAGRPIKGTCFKCRKYTELVPLEPNLKKMEPGIIHLYRIQQALDEAVRRGERLGPSGIVWPLARIMAYDQWREREGESGIIRGSEGAA